MKRTVSAMEARKKFGEILEDVSRGDEVIIERAGKRMGVIVSPRRYESMERARQNLTRFIEENWRRTADISEEEIEGIVTEAMRTVRPNYRPAKR